MVNLKQFVMVKLLKSKIDTLEKQLSKRIKDGEPLERKDVCTYTITTRTTEEWSPEDKKLADEYLLSLGRTKVRKTYTVLNIKDISSECIEEVEALFNNNGNDNSFHAKQLASKLIK